MDPAAPTSPRARRPNEASQNEEPETPALGVDWSQAEMCGWNDDVDRADTHHPSPVMATSPAADLVARATPYDVGRSRPKRAAHQLLERTRPTRAGADRDAIKEPQGRQRKRARPSKKRAAPARAQSATTQSGLIPAWNRPLPAGYATALNRWLGGELSANPPFWVREWVEAATNANATPFLDHVQRPENQTTTAHPDRQYAGIRDQILSWLASS